MLRLAFVGLLCVAAIACCRTVRPQPGECIDPLVGKFASGTYPALHLQVNSDDTVHLAVLWRDWRRTGVTTYLGRVDRSAMKLLLTAGGSPAEGTVRLERDGVEVVFAVWPDIEPIAYHLRRVGSFARLAAYPFPK